MKITIADGEFLPYGKSQAGSGDNAGVSPTYFEWEWADPQSARFVTDRYLKDARGEGQIAILSEPFFFHPENYLCAMGKNFDAVLTHNYSFVANRGWLWYPFGGSMVDFNLWGVREKTKNVSLIATDKTSTRGHRLRREAYEKYGDKVDATFGFTERTRKFDCLADYRFSVTIESEKTRHMFTERLIDCFAVGTIPIYWGCPEIGKFFDARGVIEVDSLEDIGRALDNISEEAYLDHLDAVRNNFEVAARYRLSEDWMFTYYPHLFQ